MFKTNQKKRKGNSSSDSNPPRKKRKFNPPKFGNLPSKSINSKPSPTTSTTATSSKQHKSSSKPPSKPNKRNKSKKFVALMPQRGLPLKMKPKSFKNGTIKNNAKSDNNAPKKEMIFGRKGKGKKFKFVPPKIVDHEAAKRNLRAYVADLYSAYGKALGCLGFRKEKTTLPKHDPEDDGAIVLWRPEELSDSDESDDDVKDGDVKDGEEDSGSEGEVQQFKISSKVKNALATKSKKKKGNKHKIKVPIVVDPRLGCKLRHHQVVGVEFVYRCMMDKKYAPNNEYGEGCILADGMGLGKTLQAITVMWTLMEQDVFAGEQTCSNGIVISPASLVANWELEIAKWLGKTGKTMKPYPCLSKTKDVIKNWLSAVRSANCGAIKPVLIISYESYRSYHETICYKNGKKNKIKNEIGFVVCDEGHKLKNYKSQLSVAVSRIKSKKRMLLSGTPIQNDLKEMYSLVNFVNPGVWSSVKDFSSDACRIVRSFDSSASKKVNRKGEQALNSVRSILNKFLLQRTSKVVMKYLPKKSEYVVFCKLSAFQIELYQTFLKSKIAKQAKDAASSGSGLSAIGFLAVAVLSKICNHPALIYEQCAKIEQIKINKSKWRLISSASKGKGKKKKKKKANVVHSTSSEYDRDGNRIRTELKGLFHLYPSDFLDRYISAAHSSKMAFTLSLLSQLRDQSTGDKTVIVSVFTETLDILALILQKCCIDYKRLDGSIPTKKRQPIVDEFNDANSRYLVLLLSNRAGGCGLNLIGANRLIMFDADWNPANDAQAMARVWRSGQLKETYIYRLFSTGTLEEKIFQRQTFKSDLAEQLVAAEEDMTDMTEFAVKELKKIFVYNASTDCDTLERTKKKGYTSWIKTKVCVMCGDPFLTRAAKPGKVSFLFRRIVNDPKDRIDAAEDKNHNVGKEEVDEDNDVVMKENVNKFGNTRSESRRRSSSVKSVKSNKSESESTSLLVLKKKKKKMVNNKKKSVADKKKGKVLDLVSDSDDDGNYADYSESDGDFKPKYDSQSDSDSQSDID